MSNADASLLTMFCAAVFAGTLAVHNWRRAKRAEARLLRSMEALASLPEAPGGAGLFRTAVAIMDGPGQAPVPDPGKQALAMLQRGDDCNWYSIKHDHNEMHEAFDCLEIYWRTEVEHLDQNKYGYRGPFESKAGFRVRWHVAATNKSHVEAYGLDLMTTILEARELADRAVERKTRVVAMDQKHPVLEAWKERGEKREYSFHGLDLEKWSVRLDYPGGLAWADHADLEQAVVDALLKAPP